MMESLRNIEFTRSRIIVAVIVFLFICCLLCSVGGAVYNVAFGPAPTAEQAKLTGGEEPLAGTLVPTFTPTLTEMNIPTWTPTNTPTPIPPTSTPIPIYTPTPTDTPPPTDTPNAASPYYPIPTRNARRYFTVTGSILSLRSGTHLRQHLHLPGEAMGREPR